MSKNLEVPKENGKDHIHTIVKTALGEVPLAGGALAEIFSTIIESPFQRRKKEWMQNVVDAINELKDKGFSPDDLRDNEQFISAVFYASHLAMKTHQQEKLDALRNAIINVAEGSEPDEALQQIFLNYIDQFTLLHIKLLRFALERNVSDSIYMGSLRSVLLDMHPELSTKESLVDLVWKELYTGGLVTQNTLVSTLSNNGLRQKITTSMGDRFVKFIKKR
ncbi:hypothetical protein ACR3LR_10320 [Pantoea eucalypti]|uniref:hypothetical protein n=1 Tax=Pantoea eucalypti TaxID=470933 RepID=UPI00111E3F50|nr:hypothetical protein FJP68_01950 [Pantoea vagans]